MAPRTLAWTNAASRGWDACHRRLIALASALVLLGTVSASPVAGQEHGFSISPAEELEIGRKEHPRLLREFGGQYQDFKLADYVDAVGQRLVQKTEKADLKFTFTVLNTQEVQALALPGGYVYVTRGLMSLVSSEAELAGVLGHEIAHVTARHTAERYNASLTAQLGTTAIDVVGAVVGVPPVLGSLSGPIAQWTLSAYSRDQEREADRLGILYMTRAGYDPKGLVTFFRKLRDHTRLMQKLTRQPAGGGGLLATHPRTEERITQAVSLATLPPGIDPIVSETMYLTQINGMVFGSPKQAVNGRLPRIRIVKVRAQDSVKSLSQLMPFKRHDEDWFRTLNGLSRFEEVSAGQLMKIVTFR